MRRSSSIDSKRSALSPFTASRASSRAALESGIARNTLTIRRST
jgi:hypothetical protein